MDPGQSKTSAVVCRAGRNEIVIRKIGKKFHRLHVESGKPAYISSRVSIPKIPNPTVRNVMVLAQSMRRRFCSA
jgi:hypothetical protein